MYHMKPVTGQWVCALNLCVQYICDVSPATGPGGKMCVWYMNPVFGPGVQFVCKGHAHDTGSVAASGAKVGVSDICMMWAQ